MTSQRSDETETFLRLLACTLPEQSQRLYDTARRLGLTFELDDAAEEILFHAHSDINQIVVGRKCLLRLRAHAFAYVFCWSSLGNQTAEYRSRMRSREARDEYFAAASRMLTWAMGRELQIAYAQRGDTWKLEQVMRGAEADLPPDIFDSVPETQRILAAKVAKSALAYILFHEITHLEVGDVRREGPESVEQERQADRIAAERLLEDPSLPRTERLGRLLGIAVALLWLASLNVYLGPGEITGHPPGYDRLSQILRQFVHSHDQEEWESVCWFVALSLFLHVENRGLDYDPERLNAPPDEIADYLIDLISRA